METVADLETKYAKANPSEEKEKPVIIAIMNESFADFRVHRYTGIILFFQNIYDGICVFVIYILLIGDRTRG